jgi:acyl-CoA synthetase (AMP-forming)/AMP-acid ligase II
MLTGNSSEAMVSLFGVMQAGAVAVPVNNAFKGDYLYHQLATAERRSSSWTGIWRTGCGSWPTVSRRWSM